MQKDRIADWLKVIVAGSAVCGLVIYAYAIPEAGRILVRYAPEFSGCFWPWLIFLWLTGLPCYAVLLLIWKIAGSIRRGEAFTRENSCRFREIALLASGDTLFFLAGNVIFLLLGKNHPSLVFVSLGLCFFGCAVAVAARALSMLTDGAADLQEQSDLTI